MSSVTPTEIRNAVETGLSELLGTYSFPSGQRMPSFRVDDGTRKLPQEPTVEGLEVVYQVDSGPVRHQGLFSKNYSMSRTDRIVLKQWDETKNTNEAAGLLIPLLNNLYVGNLNMVKVPRGSPFQNIEVQTFTFTRFTNT